MKNWRVAAFVFVALMLVGAGERDNGRVPTSPEARSALATYNQKLRAAREVMHQSAVRARKELLIALNAALSHALENKNLDEANRIKAAIDAAKDADALDNEVGVGPRAQAEGLAKKLTDTKWQYAERVPRILFTFNRDGSIGAKDDNLKWRWAPLDAQRVALLYPDGVIDVLQFNEAVDEYRQAGAGWGGKRVVNDQ